MSSPEGFCAIRDIRMHRPDLAFEALVARRKATARPAGSAPAQPISAAPARRDRTMTSSSCAGRRPAPASRRSSPRIGEPENECSAARCSISRGTAQPATAAARDNGRAHGRRTDPAIHQAETRMPRSPPLFCLLTLSSLRTHRRRVLVAREFAPPRPPRARWLARGPTVDRVLANGEKVGTI